MIKIAKDFIIRSSSAEFLIFESQKGQKGVSVRFEDGDLWLSQSAMTELYDTSKQDVSYHLKNIFETFELEENSTIRNFEIVQKEGNREVSRNIAH